MSDHNIDTDVRETKDSVKPKSPASPGGNVSPQRPGMTPDRSSIPGFFSTRVPRATEKRRPLSQYGTTEEIMQVFSRVPDAEMTPKDFEQANASFEELRRANLSALPPKRPAQPAIAAPETAEAIPSETSAS